MSAPSHAAAKACPDSCQAVISSEWSVMIGGRWQELHEASINRAQRTCNSSLHFYNGRMMWFLRSAGAVLLLSSMAVADSREEFFEKRIRPVLVEYCYECHATNADDIMGGLVLDSAEGWRSGGDSGSAIMPGQPDESLLLEAISYANRDLEMPPDNALPKNVIDDFRRWIRDGAVDPRKAPVSGAAVEEFDLEARRAEHWAWQPLQDVDHEQGIDGFIERRLTDEGVVLAEGASARDLIRRLSFDLIGLPPTIDEVTAFEQHVAVDRGSAIESVVNRLLGDPRFGEHWAAQWLDLVQFAETKGHVTDQERPYAWKYRDYVIDALNDDLPYDRFVMEHLAGDLLPVAQQRAGHRGETNVSPTATGALFMHEMHFMAVDPVLQRWDEIDAQIDVVGKAFLGLTTECARCHDHKFDAISQQDYYSLAGFFYSTEQGTVRVAPRATLPAHKQEEVMRLENAYGDFLTARRNDRLKAQKPKAGGDYFPVSEELGIQSPNQSRKLKALREPLEAADPSWSGWVRAAVAVDNQDVPLLIRGNHRKKGPVVPRRFLTALRLSSAGSADAKSLPETRDRRWLAEQIVAETNPLTPRVYVNRLWHHLFGQGIVRTPSNFGKLGDRPSHPELLDYLARRLVSSGWSTKTMIREIVLSQAYQRSSVPHAEPTGFLAEHDPGNRLLSHQNEKRLTAEQLRDAMLACADSLDATMYGPSVDCYVPPYATANKPGNVPVSGPVDGANRRSVYIKVRRNFFDPFLLAFDFPDRGRSVGRRAVTSVPGQALAMLNSPLVNEIAADWGGKLAEQDGSIEDRIRGVWMTLLAREPSKTEVDEMRHMVASLESSGQSKSQVWKSVVHVAFNHAEFLWLK